MNEFVSMYLFVITSQFHRNRFVWSASMRKAHEYASRIYTNSFSVRAATPQENEFVRTTEYAI